MSSLIDISMFGNKAEVLMVLFNNAGVGSVEGSLRPTMNLDEAMEELSATPQFIITIDSRDMRLHFDGTDMLDCTQYEAVNHMSPGYAQEVLDKYLFDKKHGLASATV